MESEWIDTNAQQPEDFGEYLISFTATLGGRRTKMLIEIAEFDGFWDVYHIMQYGYRNITVHAWMPLPEPYEEVKINGKSNN